MLAKLSVTGDLQSSTKHLNCSLCVCVCLQAQAASWPSWSRSPRVVRSWPCWSSTSWSPCTSPSEPATCRSTWAGRRWCSSPSPSSSWWSSPSPGSSSTTSRGSATPTRATATRYGPVSPQQAHIPFVPVYVLFFLIVWFIFFPSASCEVLWSELSWQLAEQKQGEPVNHQPPEPAV